ncbi:MAG: FGGY-family carbohydrate kinase, partial [Acidobacteriota bacterium]
RHHAVSLNVLKPGEMAATAGTSGVVYAVSDAIRFDPACRVNTFAHVNYTQDSDRLGVLLCINGTGISNSWLKKTFRDPDLDYGEMNSMAQQVGIGSDGLRFLPFGNGAERMLENRNIGAQLHNLNFNMHSRAHLMRAVQEGVALAFKYGMDLMGDLGVRPKVIRAGCANMFLSPVFREVLAGVTGATIELYNTDGAQGAARGAAIGLGYYRSLDEAFHGLHRIRLIEPEEKLSQQHGDIYAGWLNCLNRALEAQRVRPES